MFLSKRTNNDNKNKQINKQMNKCILLINAFSPHQSTKHTVELQWLGHFWDYESLFETGVV